MQVMNCVILPSVKWRLIEMNYIYTHVCAVDCLYPSARPLWSYSVDEPTLYSKRPPALKRHAYHLLESSARCVWTGAATRCRKGKQKELEVEKVLTALSDHSLSWTSLGAVLLKFKMRFSTTKPISGGNIHSLFSFCPEWVSGQRWSKKQTLG